MGRSGSLSIQSRGIDPHVEIRRGEGAQINCAGKLGVPPEGEGMLGNFLSCIKSVKYRFKFQEGTWDFSRDAAVGNGIISRDGETSWFSSSCGGIPE